MKQGNVHPTLYERIPAFASKERRLERIVNAIVETPKGSRRKYALEPDYGIIAFHELMPEGLTWPYDYGFIPQTIAPDGDPLDILIISDVPTFSGCLYPVRVIGGVREVKDGAEDDRLIAVPLPSPGASQTTDDWYSIENVPPSIAAEIKRFLFEYSHRQGHPIEIKGTYGPEQAMDAIKKTRHAFKKKRAA
jgi:inorganic pyrophosphatase